MNTPMNDRPDRTTATGRPDLATAPLSRRSMLGLVGAVGVGAVLPAAAAGVATAAPRAMTSFSDLRGVPVYYGLQTSPRTWQCTTGFLPSLQAWMDTLQAWSGGGATSIGSAGFYVDKAGQHGAGTAFDLSIVRWQDGTVCDLFNGDHAAPAAATRRRYLAVEATTRAHFRFVLDGWYNTAHENHIHADFGGLPARRILTGSSSDTKFAQAVCRNFTDPSIAIDGQWGPLTDAAVGVLKQRLGVTGNLTTDTAAVLSLLDGIAAHGFAGTEI